MVQSWVARRDARQEAAAAAAGAALAKEQQAVAAAEVSLGTPKSTYQPGCFV